MTATPATTTAHRGAPKLPPRGGRIAEEKRQAFLAAVAKGTPYTRAATDLGLQTGAGYHIIKAAIRDGILSETQAKIAGFGKQPRREMAKKEARLHIWLEAPDERTRRQVYRDLDIPHATGDVWTKRWKELKAKQTQLAEQGEDPPIAFDELSDKAKQYLGDFGLFRRHVLDRTWNPPWAIETAEKLLAAYYSPDDRYIVLNVAPGVGKSTLLTHDFVIWVIALERSKGREPRILLGHRQWKKSTWYVRRCRHTFANNRTLVDLYGRFRPLSREAPWSTEEILVEPLDWKNLAEKEPTITAAAYDASVLSGRHGLIIWDDLIDKANSSTVEQREKLKAWWEIEAETRLEPGGLLVLSNARYGPEDLSWEVLQTRDESELDIDGRPLELYERIRFSVHDEARCSGEHEGLEPWPASCLLDPMRAGWRRIRKAMLQSDARFGLVWQQEDTDPTGFLAQSVWFAGGVDSHGVAAPGCFEPNLRFGQLPPWGPAPLLSAVTIDPSVSRFWAVQHFLLYPDGRHLLYRAIRRTLQAPEILYQDADAGGAFTGILVDWHEASYAEGVPFTYLIVEKNNHQRWLMQYPFFPAWCASKGISIIPHETIRANKPDPVRGFEMLGPIYRHGLLTIPYGGYEEKLIGDTYKKEATAWPEGATDDLLMGHWFFTHRMTQLASIEGSGQNEDEDVPTYIKRSMGEVPRWARRALDRTGSMAG